MTIHNCGGNPGEIIVIVGHQSHQIQELKFPESIRFSEPEARVMSPWQTWKDLEAFFTNKFRGKHDVRFREVKVVLNDR
jgi:hypothetical protein